MIQIESSLCSDIYFYLALNNICDQQIHFLVYAL